MESKRNEDKSDERLLDEAAASGMISALAGADKSRDKAKYYSELRQLIDSGNLYYKEKDECTRMTNILRDNEVVGFHAILSNQKRSCCGNKNYCYFVGKKQV